MSKSRAPLLQSFERLESFFFLVSAIFFRLSKSFKRVAKIFVVFIAPYSRGDGSLKARSAREKRAAAWFSKIRGDKERRARARGRMRLIILTRARAALSVLPCPSIGSDKTGGGYERAIRFSECA